MHVAVRKVLPFVHEKRSNYNLHDLDRNRGLDSDSFAVEVSCSNNTCVRIQYVLQGSRKQVFKDMKITSCLLGRIK
jgi:hypothetical protein